MLRVGMAINSSNERYIEPMIIVYARIKLLRTQDSGLDASGVNRCYIFLHLVNRTKKIRSGIVGKIRSVAKLS